MVEVSRSHSDTPHSIGLLWTSDRLIPLPHNTQQPAEFEPAIPASERQQTHTLDCATTGIRQQTQQYTLYSLNLVGLVIENRSIKTHGVTISKYHQL